jgi:hypothetical protein
MKLHILTIVLDGMPFLPMQLNILNRLNCDWHWYIVEGAAANANCTSWCQRQDHRLSLDGTHEFLVALKGHPRVSAFWKDWWPKGKVEMCNYALPFMREPGWLLQMDADELWTPSQLEAMPRLLASPLHEAAAFRCRYFVGPNIVTLGTNCYGNNPGEWLRLWRFIPGMMFRKHEPPILEDSNGRVQGAGRLTVSRDQTAQMGFSFDHWAYVFESQVAYKEKFYGYFGATMQWRRLQEHAGPWPARLKDFLQWVDDRAIADLLHKP